MATFKLQVEGITSLSIGTTPTEDELSQFLVDGIKEVANRIITIRPDEIGKFTKSTNDASDAGITLTGQVFSVVREHDNAGILRACSPINPGDRYAASDSTSLSYRSKYNPGFYVLDGKIHTVPASAAGNNDSIVTQVYYAINTGHSSSSIDNFPDEYEYLVVLYTSLKTISANMGAKTIDDQALSSVLPDLPVVPNFTLTVSTSLPTYSAPTTTINGTAWATAYTDQHVAISTALGKITTEIGLAKAELPLDAFSLTAVTPDIPVVPNFTFTVGTSLPTYAGPTQTINAINWAIAYPDQQATIDTALAKVSTALNAVDALGLTKLTLDPFSITAVTPDVPTIPNFTISPATSLPDYTKLTALHDPGVPTDLSDIYDWSQSVTDIGAFAGITAVAPDTPSLTPVTFVGAGDGHTAYAITSTDSAFVTSLADISAGTSAVLTGTAPIYLPPAPPDRPDMEGAITDQDIEMLSANAQQYQTDLGAYQAEMSDAQNTFNEESTEYQANVQKDMAKAQADNAAVLQNLQKNLTIAQSDAQVVNTVRAANQAAELQNAVTDMQRIINDNTRLLSYWQQEISQYQAEVGVEVQDYQQKLSKYSQEVQTELTVWQQRRQGELSEHSQKIARFQAIMSDELNDFNTELQKYQAEVQTLLQRAQYEQQAENAANLQQYQAELGTYGAEVNSQTQEYTQYLAEQQQEFTSAVTTYQTLIQTAQAFSAEIQMRLAPRSVEISEYQARMGDALNSFNTELQKYQTELQKVSQKAQYEQQAEHAAQLQQYQAEVATFGAEVNSEVQDYSQYLAGKAQAVAGYIQIAQAYIAESQALLAPKAVEIQEYQSRIGNALNLFNTELQKYQAELQKELQEAQYEQQAEHASQLQQYQAEVATYQAEVGAAIQEYQNNLEADQAEYTWLQDQYTRLKAEYDAAFIGLAPLRQAEQSAGERPRA